jgi:hypothetical protein
MRTTKDTKEEKEEREEEEKEGGILLDLSAAPPLSFSLSPLSFLLSFRVFRVFRGPISFPVAAVVERTA